MQMDTKYKDTLQLKNIIQNLKSPPKKINNVYQTISHVYLPPQTAPVM